ncbi:disease resistance protein Roq1-like isoform X3 [Prosopis cineraria]|uniref:disease resistance protein Roq1-like isoform X3 n=1 Tax=Prosopis cineraria TaxID=364024 RepID=UPI002410691D|nr:disease resistance protein Roq1-like isoform X3 [Prosopis cineraria]
MAAPGPSTASTSPMRYHVFLSFRGTDTRTNFTDHLYAALLRQGIVTFRDDVDLHKGHVIKDELLQAIEQSMFAIVVLSKNYAASSWCLDELRKILKSKKASGQTVFPVFYGIDPSDVRHQKRKFATAFEKHEVRFPDVKVRRWRKALRKIAKLSGWDTSNKHEAEIVEDIVKSVWNKLCLKLPSNFGHLVGDIQSKVDRIISLLKIGLGDKCFVGIWGMGGIGKTTLSRVVYDALQSKFEASCFLANLREDCEKSGLVYLQKKLLSGLGLREPKIDDAYDGVKKIRGFLCHKKVLIVLDDISHKSQLDNLAGTEEWFGEGSKIIMTTRDKQLLTQYEQFEEYGVGKLNEDESLKLLCHKAFKKDEPKEAYLDFSKEVVKYACGLPLALEVLGSFLCNRDPVQWRDALDKLKENLHKDIFSKLCISYEGLEDEQYRNIFLDIACLFIRTSKAEVTDILKICGLHSVIGINVLIEKSLLSTFKSQSLGNNWGSYCNVHQYMDDGLRKMRREIFIDREQLEYYYPQDHLTMHDLLQEMGRNIVLRESSDACKRSRLWRLEEIDHMLKRNKGTKKVQSICLNIAQKFKAEWHPDCFLKMENLRLLDLSGVCLSRNLNVLPSSLKFLRWDFYALKSLPSIDQLCELESLELRSSKIERLWNGAPGPIHIFYDYYVPLGFPWRVGIPEWFEGEDHCRSRESSSSEEVLTITANIPCDRADANNGECWGIAVALIFGCRSYGNDKCFSVNWKFQDYCHTNKRTANKEINSAKYYFVHRVYVGYYPFKKEDCRPHPSGVGIQLHLTLSFPTNPAAKLGLFANWKIVNCRWRLTCQKHFDEGR